MKKFEALAFDTGGNVFNWKGAIESALAEVVTRQGIEIDGERFSIAWRRHALLALFEARSVSLPHMNARALLPLALERVAQQYPDLQLDDRSRATLMRAWYQMPVQEDFPIALSRIRGCYPVLAFTMLDFAMATASSRWNGITWDGVISCENLCHYKPEPEAYHEACELMGYAPAEVCLVGSHAADLLAARAAGMGAAYVEPRLKEPHIPGFDPEQPAEIEGFDHYASSHEELADALCLGWEDNCGNGYFRPRLVTCQ